MYGSPCHLNSARVLLEGRLSQAFCALVHSPLTQACVDPFVVMGRGIHSRLASQIREMLAATRKGHKAPTFSDRLTGRSAEALRAPWECRTTSGGEAILHGS